ncbi:clan AA aspartic protease [Okeania sp. SIO2B3]|uniref:clan AA aspartic protease n=1 Tax=Okeania sp. SIO2B3 TaxID=2607784 RepID=UPI0025E9FF98|nr:clan AA aspartic protease [Okeania sp. SIO2B3]
MISGIVNNGYPTVSITFRLPDHPNFSIQFVIDTGFTDELCLPSEVVALLGLPFRFAMPANLADNTEVILPVYEAIIAMSAGVFTNCRRGQIAKSLILSVIYSPR